MEILVENYHFDKEFGWGYTFTPTGEGTSIETPSGPDYTGTIEEIRQAIRSDKTWQVHSRTAFYNSAWFYKGRRITHTWRFDIVSAPENDDDINIQEYYDACKYGYTWVLGFFLDIAKRNIKIRVE